MKESAGIREEDFELFRNGISSGRLNPIWIGKVLIAFPFAIFVFLYASNEAFKYSSVISDSWTPVLEIQWVLLGVLSPLSVLFRFKTISIKYQRLQMVTLIVSFILLAFSMTYAGLSLLSAENASFPFTFSFWTYIVCSLATITFFLIRAFILLRKGAFRKNGRGMLWKNYYKNSKHRTFSFLFFAILPFTIAGGALARLGLQIGDVIYFCASLVASLIIYTIGITEYIFVLYCKFRFPSFQITAEKQRSIDRESNEINDMVKQIVEEAKAGKNEKKKG